MQFFNYLQKKENSVNSVMMEKNFSMPLESHNFSVPHFDVLQNFANSLTNVSWFYNQAELLTEFNTNSHSEAGNRNLAILSAERPFLAPAITPVVGLVFPAKKLIWSRICSFVTSFVPLNTYDFGNKPKPNSCTYIN